MADWLPNVQTPGSEAFYRAFRARYPDPSDDYVHMRLQLMVEALAQAIAQSAAGGAVARDAPLDVVAVARALEQASVGFQGQRGTMRASDHQFQQPLVVGVMDRLGTPGVRFDVEGSGYGFRVIKTLTAAAAEMPTSCQMQRP